MVYGENSRGWAERYWDQKESPTRLCSLDDQVTGKSEADSSIAVFCKREARRLPRSKAGFNGGAGKLNMDVYLEEKQSSSSLAEMRSTDH